jgi:hypothetical protein
MANPFDQFDAKETNPFDQFDKPQGNPQRANEIMNNGGAMRDVTPEQSAVLNNNLAQKRI